MFGALFRSMLVHRLRLVLTGLAIALGVAFMSGSFVFSSTLSSSLDSLFAQASTGTDVQDACVRRYQRGEGLAENADSAVVNVPRMNHIETAHLRPKPRMLRKKLDRSV